MRESSKNNTQLFEPQKAIIPYFVFGIESCIMFSFNEGVYLEATYFDTMRYIEEHMNLTLPWLVLYSFCGWWGRVWGWDKLEMCGKIRPNNSIL
jgi:hypothetical protein